MQTQARGDLKAIAEKHTGADSISEGRDLYRVAARKGFYELVKVREYAAQTSLGQNLSIQVAAASGKVFELKNKEYHFGTVQADVHPRWHNEALEKRPLPFLKVHTESGRQYSNADGEFEASGEQAPYVAGLRGNFVEIFPKSGDRVSASAVEGEDGSWLLQLSKPGEEDAWLDSFIAQTMVYYHTNLIIAKAKEYISHMNWALRNQTS